MDTTLDQLHDQQRVKWIRGYTPFSFPVFVVWKTTSEGARKGRMVVDIRGLNAVTQPDVYALPSQEDIINAVGGHGFITVLDASSFFYQWRVKPEDTHKLTIHTHRGQETFLVPVMGARNSPAYVQRMIDRVIRGLLNTNAYIDDIVVFSRTLDEYVEHLLRLFTRLTKFRISIAPKKTFVGFPSIQLLGRNVDAFGFSTLVEKVQAIAALDFPHRLKDLESYLGMAGRLRIFVPYFSALAEPL